MEKRSSNILIVTICAALVLIFLGVSFLRIFFKDYELRKEIERTQADVSKLEKRKIESLELLKRLQSDAYVEDRAHAELQATRPGETVIVVPGLSVTSTAAGAVTPPTAAPQEKPPLSNSETWWYYFFLWNKKTLN